MQGGNSRPPGVRDARRRAVCLGFALAALVLASCSTERRYQTLTFFFDGVPDPNAPPEEVTETEGEGAIDPSLVGRGKRPVIEATAVVHPPFEDKACDTCHTFSSRERSGGFQGIDVSGAFEGGRRTTLVMPVQELCVMCHDQFSAETAVAEGEWLHGPVGGGYCTMCHSPHRSSYAHLLLAETIPELCFRCHDVERLSANEDHPPVEDALCTDCHNPHEGDSRFLL